ncbi:MAG: DUF2029 domain-containing protein [Chloroflexota bacterium]|nr:DUF2029 domain-containing protein [Chloroflexota bacterium]
MSIKQALHPPLALNTSIAIKRPWLTSLLLFLLLSLSISLYMLLIPIIRTHTGDMGPFVHLWLLCFLPYFAACALIFIRKPGTGRWLWLELTVILIGALLLRALLVPFPPVLSRDSWRYIWDARVTLLGYSPYVYVPNNPLFVPLRDFIYYSSDHLDVPTIYPPVSQGIYVLSYLLAPSNLFFLKGIFVAFDMGTCVALAGLLVKRGLDPRRTILYAWSPLVIVEFALSGHVDVLTITFMVLALLCASCSWRGSRAIVGFLIALATMTKLYPILLLAVVLRRRDYALLITCFATILAAYTPYLILGHGQAFGFFSSYASEQGGNAGAIQLVTYSLGSTLNLPFATIVMLQHIVDVLVVSSASLIVFMLRQRERISMETGTMVLIGVVLSLSSHIFPWYTTAFLPWVAVLAVPVLSRNGLSGKGIAIAMVWYFSCIVVISYLFNYGESWNLYYASVYGVVIAGLGVAALIGMIKLCNCKHNPV